MGFIGTVAWCVIRAVTHYELGIVAMLVGYVVGKAVRKGSGGWGGRGYQLLAVLITYVCIAATFVPDILVAFNKRAEEKQRAKLAAQGDDMAADKPGAAGNGRAAGEDSPDHVRPAGRSPLAPAAAVAVLLAFSLAIPVIIACHDPIMLIIFGIALWEAWKFTARVILPIKGPFQLGPRPA